MKRHFLFLFLLAVLVLPSCKKDRLNVNVSGIKAPVNLVRLEQEIFGRPSEQLIDSVAVIRDKVGSYFDLYSYEVIGIGGFKDEGFNQELERFVTDSVFRRVADSVIQLFGDFSLYEKKLEKAFKHYRYYFPNEPIPTVYTQVSGFNQSVVVDSAMVGISLENYMGANCLFYKYLAIPEYKRSTMYPEKIVPDLFYSMATVRYPFQSESNHMLDHMIYQGKLLYFAEAMCPDTHDSTIIGFSGAQLDWCQSNEALMWAYLAENKLLYNSERLILRKFMGDAPYTPDFTQQSPGRAVVWIGWQIVREYMDKNPEVTFDQLFGNKNAQNILAISGYLPD